MGTVRRTEYLQGQISKDFDPDSRVISGMASTSAEDREGDTIEPTAFADSLGGRLKLLFNHKQDVPIGKIVRAEIKETGLWIEAKLASGTEKANEVWSLIEQGILDSFSVGFIPTAWELISPKSGDYGPKRFTKADLLEVSVVTIPANPNAVMDGTSMAMEAVVTRQFAERASQLAQELGPMQERHLEKVVARAVEERLSAIEQAKALSGIDWSAPK